jgi:hypothetical protein
LIGSKVIRRDGDGRTDNGDLISLALILKEVGYKERGMNFKYDAK